MNPGTRDASLRSPAWLRIVLALAACGVASYLFYRRFTPNFDAPNFYAEDGRDFADKLLHDGFIRSLSARFNGYYVWGIFLVGGLGEVIDAVLYRSEFVTLPQSFALASYLFFGFLATMPLWLFRGWLPLRYRIVWTLLNCFVPMPSGEFAILGTIGNLKFAFVYIAFMLCLYRSRMPDDARAFAVDLAIVWCGYTNATVYLLMPFLLLRYWPQIRGGDWRELVRSRSFQSLVLLGLLLLPQLVVVKLYGIPKIPGYLDTPFRWNRAVELLAYRPYTYALTYWFHGMRDAGAIASLAFLVVGGLAVARPAMRPALGFAIYAGFATTFLFALNRPGITSFFERYRYGGPDQFFYTQNLIFYAFLVLALHELSFRLAQRRVREWAPVVVLMLCLLPLRSASSWGTTGGMKEDVGPIFNQVTKLCARTEPMVDLTIYPRRSWVIHVERERLCTSGGERYALAHEDPKGTHP